jgi:aspartyl/asparaginyl beta-hydroxylase (cupin superfamily)/Flp pilus assembly protein TadD
MGDPRVLLDQASQLRQAGDLNGAATLLRNGLAQQPDIAAGWNMLGIVQLETGDPAGAATSLERAVGIDPSPVLLLNLARAQRAAGDRASELESLNRALSIEPYFLPAIIDKGDAQIALGQEAEALELYRLLFEGLDPNEQFPPAIAERLAAARQLLDRAGEAQMESFSRALDEVAAEHEGADLRRVQAYAENRAGKRKIFPQKPTGSHFPYLPAIEFFDRSLLPWFEELEQHTDAIRQEMMSLWADDDDRFRPYVAYGEGVPLNQWAELNHSLRWSAWFFWENGVRNDENCARCPRTAAAIEASPILDIPGKAPTAMFSILQPHTRIPPHTGTSNTRTTVHLPLIVPPGCGFRVGAETREWREGEAWAFDDTIEHEAWNDSDQPRAILIIDTWNPLLTEAEREVVRRIG